jgi:hypothetical protein
MVRFEREFIHLEVGHVAIEDAVAVRHTGCDGLGDLAQGWQFVEG